MVFKHFPALNALLMADVCSIYCECFINPPWSEPDWTIDAAKSVFEGHLAKRGDVFLATNPEFTEVFGFGLGLALKDYDLTLAHYDIPQDSYWFSDVGTKSTHRRQGIASVMIALRQERAKELQFNTISTRTLPGCTQHRLLKKHGFKDHHTGLFQTGGKLSERVLMLKEI